MTQTTHTSPADMTWKALGDPSRRHILDLLHDGTRTTTDICENFVDLSRFQVMGHLSVLRDAGLVKTEKQGRERLNALETGPMREAYDEWLRKYEVEWAGRLGRLKRHVENQEKEKAMDAIVSPDMLGTIELEREIEMGGPPSAVFKGLTDDIGEWFGAPYLQTGSDARDMILDAKPGGKWIEVTKAGDGAVWGEVQEIQRDKMLAIEGRMGMRPAVFARIVFKLSTYPKGCLMTMTFKGVGHFSREHEEKFTEGLVDLFGVRLKAYAEGGKPTGIRANV
ncbi:MAG: helix-turn-helix domain-containing protein [Rhodospirillaceae bacterium]|nr:helix-turn-helix domain-containing protein [Rhodospirillaceae bacterium]MBT6089280.1 helix-turn-helix domain-containing protein [Rhodospirillaceae bacterium]MBT6961150.1 helix-turn-helix domain-containing protein [Rhodospirillaceae bacterium]